MKIDRDIAEEGGFVGKSLRYGRDRLNRLTRNFFAYHEEGQTSCV